MPRNYIKKRNKTYSPQDLANAIQKVKNGELTAYAAAQEYKIPMTTLHDHVNECKATIRPNAGRPTVLPLEDEQRLANTIITMEKWGFGLSRSEIIEIVAEYVRVNNIQTPFKNNTPGPDWFINFRKRHGLSIKKAQPVEYVRRKMTDPFIIAEYFDLLHKTLQDLNLLDKPGSIYNLDETSLCLDPTKTKVVGQRNKPCARTTYGSGKENITVLAGASASGKKLPPLIIFKGKFVWDQWMADLNKDDYDFELTYAASTKGWMETDIFYNYFEKVLIPNLGEDRPALIIYDGHSTHVDTRVVELAVRNSITILKLPPHTSHLLQPLDISVFKSFKTIWDAKLVEWQRRNVGIKMPKNIFAKTMADTWQETNPEVIKSGFKKAGIYPFNSDVIPIDKYDPDVYQRYKKHLLANSVKQPRSLKNICIESVNNQFAITNSNNVAMLSEQSRTDDHMLSFVARHPSQVPACLQNSQPSQSATRPKITILSNIVIKPPSLQTPSIPERSISFEELLLKKITQENRKDSGPIKKKRITKGAEVITAALGRKLLEEVKETKSKKVATKTSNANDKRKRKREPSPDSTSISDIISDHSDSDIIDCVDFDEMMNDCEDEFNQGETSLEIPVEYSKCKGKEKRSKGKENEVNKMNEIEGMATCEDDKNEQVAENSGSDNKDLTLVRESYEVNDVVLVRYLIRKKWKYYVGYIEKIIKNEDPLYYYYDINFFKTKRQQKQLTFVETKKKDTDKVPESLLVKKIELRKKSDKDKEYYLIQDEDTIYFD